LVRVPDHSPKGRQAEQPVEAVDQGNPMGLPVQAKGARSISGCLKGSGHEIGIRLVELQGERSVSSKRRAFGG
jgi:hypothetical protein